MTNKQDTDSSGKSPVRTELADRTKKLGKLTINIRRPISEEKGDLAEIHEVMDQGQVVARYVRKDGEVLESAATADAQSAGIHEKAAKKAGVKKDDIVFTSAGMNAAEAEVEEVGSEDGDKPVDPMGEKAELSGKTKENKPKSKPSEGKKPDTSMSKMSKEKTGQADKPGDRDLSKDLEKTDKIVDIAERRRAEEKAVKENTDKRGMLSLFQAVKKLTANTQSYNPSDASDLSSEIKDLYNTRQDAAKLDKSEEEPWHDPEQHESDHRFEILLEEKLKRHFNGIPLRKADDPSEAARRMRIEHSVQSGLKGHTPAQQKVSNRPIPKAPNYKLLTAMESNAKTAKNENIEGDEGQGHFSAILHLAPATLAGVGNVCTGATDGCKDSCLNTAGRGGMFKAGEDTNAIQKARIRKTKYLAQNPGKFMDDLIHDIHQVKRHADASNKRAVVRLNGTSDVAWEDLKLPHFEGKNLFEAFPDIQFYDYTKRPDRVMKNKHANYHITFSRSDKNENVAVRLLKAGYNVAAVFGGKQLPKQWNGHPVISGDEHDLRFLDPRGGYVIGLKAKGEAQGDRTGFVVWGHEGDPTAKPKQQRGKLAGVKRVEKSEKIEKAKQEQYHDSKGKRIIREERRIAPKDPLANKKPGSNVKKSNDRGVVGRTKSGKPLYMSYGDDFDKRTSSFTPQDHMDAVNFHDARAKSGGKWDIWRAFDHYHAARKKLNMPRVHLSSRSRGLMYPEDHDQLMEKLNMKNGDKLTKFDGVAGSAGSADPGGMKAAFGTPPPKTPDAPSAPTSSLGSMITSGVNKLMGKAMPAPAAPSKPAPPKPPVQQAPKKPKKPGETTYAAPAQYSAPMSKGEDWPVPGWVPPKSPERPANPEQSKPMSKACSEFLKKACVSMRSDMEKSKEKDGWKQVPGKPGFQQRPFGGSPSDHTTKKKEGPKEDKELKKAVVDLKTGKQVKATAKRKEAQPPKPTPGSEIAAIKPPAQESLAHPVGSLSKLKAALSASSKKEQSSNKTPRTTQSQQLKALDTEVRAKNQPAAQERPIKAVPESSDKVKGYDFEAAKKRYHEIKAKQAESIKNQDIAGKIKRNPRAP